MVRLVFRPYTQVRRSICTSESLRASTRVSPGFALLKHSSPSFGSQHKCYHSNLSPRGSRSADGAASRPPTPLTFIPHTGLDTLVLAHMLDSLVRVSRRGKEDHFVRVRWVPSVQAATATWPVSDASTLPPGLRISCSHRTHP